MTSVPKAHRPSSRVSRAATSLAAVALVTLAHPAAAQSTHQAPASSPTWSVEFYGGGLLGSGPVSGSAATPLPVGETFTTAGGFSSRAVSSWMFGDGALLFDQVADQFAARFGQQITRLSSLDSVLTGAAVERGGGATFGGRVTRRLTPRFALEFGIERGVSPLALTSDARAAIQATRATFITAFTSLANTLPQSGLTVTANADFDEPKGGTTMATGSLVMSLLTRGRFSAHAVAGVAGVFSGDTVVEAQVRGSYQFSVFGLFPVAENDRVTVRITERQGTAQGVFGGGMTYAFSDRRALRVDFRLLTGQTEVETTVSAAPGRTPGSPVVSLPSLTEPSIQFSNSPTVRTSLSGAAIQDLSTFRASGWIVRGQLTVGFLMRF